MTNNENNRNLISQMDNEVYQLLREPYYHDLEKFMDILQREWFPSLAKLKEEETQEVMYRFCYELYNVQINH